MLQKKLLESAPFLKLIHSLVCSVIYAASVRGTHLTIFYFLRYLLISLCSRGNLFRSLCPFITTPLAKFCSFLNRIRSNSETPIFILEITTLISKRKKLVLSELRLSAVLMGVMKKSIYSKWYLIHSVLAMWLLIIIFSYSLGKL